MTLDQVYVLVLPPEVLGASGAGGKKEKVDLREAKQLGVDLAAVFGRKSKVQDILARRGLGGAGQTTVADGKRAARERFRQELIERRNAEQVEQQSVQTQGQE